MQQPQRAAGLVPADRTAGTSPAARQWTGWLPRLRAWLARLPLTPEGLLWFVIASGLLLIGLLKGINLITLLASLLIVLVLWNGWIARRQVKQVYAQHCEDEPAFAETPFAAAVRLDNRGRRPVAGLEVRAGGVTAQRWLVAELAAGAAVVLRAAVVYPRRGYAEVEALTLWSGYPLGLVRVQGPHARALARVVLPRLGRLHRAMLRRLLSRRSPALGQTRGVPCQTPTAQAEFHGLRPYRPGDSPRNVHWRTSARHGELMVREYEEWPNDDLTVVVEARKDVGPSDDPRLELAIRVAATICWEWCRQSGDRLVLAVAGQTVTVQNGITGHAFARTLLERLALEPGTAVVDGNRLVAELRQRRLPAGPILVVSPTPSDLGPRLQQALRRQVAPVAAGSEDAAAFFEG